MDAATTTRTRTPPLARSSRDALLLWRSGIRMLNATFDTISLSFGKLSSKETIPREYSIRGGRQEGRISS